ncbi:MAG TPA: error-prone DNA polymerase, partial [Candidatus Limnocylindria bacterium]|nr:error-prone DNA polymerase [Candidatus Limnocylindria bacterium]
REPVTYAHPSLEPALKETLGVIIFQEQILKVAMAIAGFTPAEGDRLRRAMSRARSSADMERLRAPFVAGALRSGVPETTANEIFGQIAGFAEFGFCKSHAAAFALTAYHTAHLKLYYPAEFYVALLNNQPMGFYSPAVIAGDAKRHGVRILPVDVNVSLAKATVEADPGPGLEETSGRHALPEGLQGAIARHRKCREHHLRLGLTYVKHVGEEEADAIVAERSSGGPFRSFDDLARRVALKEEALRSLALVGAFDSFGAPRRELLWRARDAHRASPAFTRPTLAFPTTAAPSLPTLTEAEKTALDYRITGVPTGPQVMSFYRADLDRRGILRSIDLAALAHGRRVQVAGAIVVKQHPETAKGHVFLSLEDEVGISNVIIRPATYRTTKTVIDTSPAIVVEGILQNVDGVLSVLAARIEPIHLFVRLAAHEWQ